MLSRIFGLLLGLALGGAAYVVLNPGGLEGRIPPIDLGAFESVRFGVALAAGLLGAAVAVASFAGPGERRRRRDDLPVIAGFDFDPPTGPPAEAEPPAPQFEPAAASELDALDGRDPFPDTTPPAEIEPAPFPLASDEPEPAPLAAIAAGSAPQVESPHAPAESPALEPAASAPASDSFSFEAARTALHAAARAEAWSEAADALRLVRKLAVDERQHMLAAQDAGDFARAQGLTDDAIEAYDEALAYARMAGSPAETADALINVGDMAYDEHRLDYAVANYEEAVDLRRQIARDRGSPEARRSLSVALERLADAREDRGHLMRALDLYRESEAITAELAQADAARFGGDFAATRKRLEELEARVLA